MTPILEFREHKTPYGIQLIGTVTLNGAGTIPNYEPHNIDKRKVAEGYVLAEINEKFIRLRGYYKLFGALHDLERSTPSPERTLAMDVIQGLIKELQEPQFELKGNAQ